MNEKKNAEGVKFLFRLDQAALDKNKLIDLARNVIDESHDKRSFAERKMQDLRVNPTSVNLGATIGLGHAITNKNLSTNDKLYMVMHKYIALSLSENPKASKDKVLKRFCHEFAMSFPKEYGIEEAQKVAAPNTAELLAKRATQNVM
ncbi:MAG: hypothetical protein IJ770_05205 [Alphaproteobacteria bacterium]|nr:hypothetical protein [Alphaproteobacteria bacterium]